MSAEVTFYCYLDPLRLSGVYCECGREDSENAESPPNNNPQEQKRIRGVWKWTLIWSECASSMNSCMADSFGVMCSAENFVFLPLQRTFLLGIYCIIIFHGKCLQPSGMDNENMWLIWGILTSVCVCMLCITNLAYFECSIIRTVPWVVRHICHQARLQTSKVLKD